MNERIKENLANKCKSQGYGTTDDDLIELVLNEKTLWEGKRDEHRWYTLVPTVVCVDGMYLMMNVCHVKGEESSVEDCIGGYKLNDIIEVAPEQKIVTVYVPVK
jgi:hypothetical protein